MFNYFESVNLTLESVELYKLSKSVEINSVGVNSTLDFLLYGHINTSTAFQVEKNEILP